MSPVLGRIVVECEQGLFVVGDLLDRLGPLGPELSLKLLDGLLRFQMAIARRKPATRLVHHSNRGVQYTSLSFGKRLEDEGFLPSMGRVGSACNNALAEPFIATLKTKLPYRSSWPTRQTVSTAILEYIEGFYNTRRRHSSLGHLSSAEFEEVKLTEAAA